MGKKVTLFEKSGFRGGFWKSAKKSLFIKGQKMGIMKKNALLERVKKGGGL